MANTPLTKAKKLYKAKKHTGVKATAAAAAAKVKTIGGAGNGKTRTIAAKTKYYPTEDTPTPVKNNKHAGTAALRSTFTPGSVCILLAGPFRGKRVVFLKQLDHTVSTVFHSSESTKPMSLVLPPP
jgi:large subunit ribosomal protein L6e